ncbi:MAG: DegT/DnrJ/EryC1/StrS family aminotransferase [Candidatus Omnitrophica bacterium]|nr:DegT/DnrJ/EryC1/StrS family aminotransferase [Candidatus Omnitrophota bacterium]
MEKFKQPIYVTESFLPPLEEFQGYLADIWRSKWLTNNGNYHQRLERALCDYLGVKYISLFSNGTLALVTALQVLRIAGEVITTPFSFVATTHALWWNKIKPVFVDIEPRTFNLDAAKIEAAITPQTTAILPVHVYGNPCDLEGLQKIADTYGLKLIYDAAHAFGVKIRGTALAGFGDLAVLSFHATKIFNTFEGGAIVCHDAKTKKRIDFLKNFGFADETTVVEPGINAKMNEFQAALGLLQLQYVGTSIERNRALTRSYRAALGGIPGIRFFEDIPEVEHNYSYFPIVIETENYGKSRDEVYDHLKKYNVFSRRYFYPLISQFPSYRGLESAKEGMLPVAETIARQILCLPMYPNLPADAPQKIADIVRRFQERR